MQMQHSDKSVDFLERLSTFMDSHIYPNEARYAAELHAATNRFAPLPVIDELKELAKAAGLWNLFVPPEHAAFCDHGGLSNYDYAPLAEMMGRVLWCPERCN
jgi:acyl-CoA dehydrogenase